MEILLRFSNTKSFNSKIVQFGTRFWASHVDFITPDGKLLGAVPGEGVILRDENRLENDRVEIYSVKCNSFKDPHTSPIKIASKYIGRKYDWLGILGWTFNRDWEDDNRWFCSELVAFAFKQCGDDIINTNFKIWRITPRDLLLSPRLKRVG